MQGCEARELIWRCARRRDRETWDLFRERYERWLTAGVKRTLVRFDVNVTEDEREDLLQEVYCRLLEKNGRGLTRCRAEVEGAVVIYLARIAESVVVDYLRNRGAAKRGRDLVTDLGDEPGRGIGDRIADPRRSPEELLLLRERRDRFLTQCKSTLIGRRTAQRDFEVLVLALFEGWTSREISGKLDGRMTPSAVDSLVHRIKRRLQKLGVELPRR